MYPIEQSIDTIKSALQNNKDVILTAEPGAGKSTVVPLALMKEPWLQGKKIIMLQPRRVAAVAVAARMAETHGTPPGKYIGHSVRFSSNINSETKIEVLTEGILTRRIQKDPFLEDVGLVIFDEFHERSIHADLCIALCREIKREVRPDLRIMVMSATIDTELIHDYLDNPQIINGKGFLFPVTIEYKPVTAGKSYFDNAAEAIANIVENNASNEEYLVFLPGIGEINRTKDYLDTRNKLLSHNILPLHGSMTINDQQKALLPNSKPRIILATNIAETSLTINGITTVIDTGYSRQTSFDSETGLNRLELQRISKASAKQRAGRAGRLKPGKAIRLYSKAEFDFFEEDIVPEILRSDPTSTILELFTWGIKNPDEFGWLEAPSHENIKHSIELLKQLGAINNANQITDAGKKMCEIPAEPRLACMLVNAEKKNCKEEAALATAIIGEKDFLSLVNNKSPEGRYISPDPDLALRLIAFNNPNILSSEYKVDKSIIWRIQQAQQELSHSKVKQFNAENKLKDIAYTLLQAFPDRVCQRRGDSKCCSYTLCSGQGLSIDDNSLLKENEYILSLRQDSKLRAATSDGKIFLACKISLEWLLQSPMAHSVREITFSEKNHKIIVREKIKYGCLTLKEQESQLKEEEYPKAFEIFSEAVCSDINKAFALSEKNNAEFMGRLKNLQKTSFGKNYPQITKEWLTETLSNSIQLDNLSFSALQKLGISEIYFSRLSWKQREDFDRLVPERFRVPTGSNIRLDYTTDGAPILPVKLQEMFGQATTPSICNGEIQLIIHLLSPAGRPLQITSDLVSFWQNGYKIIAAEMRGRYPKHSWPEDPAHEVPRKK